MRTLPLSSITAPLPRAVRDLAAETGKEVELVVEGAETELDRVILEGLSEPLVHMLRNAVAHGIEPPEERSARASPRCGRLELRAEQRGGIVEIVVADDGRGVSEETLAEAARTGSLADVLAQPGFSTRARSASISGRGVGLDAVKDARRGVRRQLEVRSEPRQRHARSILLLPLALALLEVLLVERAGNVFGVPLASVEEALVARRDALARGPAGARAARPLDPARRPRRADRRRRRAASPTRAPGDRPHGRGPARRGDLRRPARQGGGRRQAARPAARVARRRTSAPRSSATAGSRCCSTRRTLVRGAAAARPPAARRAGRRRAGTRRRCSSSRTRSRSASSSAASSRPPATASRPPATAAKRSTRLDRDDEIDLVVTDVEMPEMDGLELTRAIRAHADALDPARRDRHLAGRGRRPPARDRGRRRRLHGQAQVRPARSARDRRAARRPMTLRRRARGPPRPDLRRLADLRGGALAAARARPRDRGRRRLRRAPRRRSPGCRRGSKPDLVTMDLELPGMSGVEAIEQIMSVLPDPDPRPLGRRRARLARRRSRALAAGALDAMRQGRPRPPRSRRRRRAGASAGASSCSAASA